MNVINPLGPFPDHIKTIYWLTRLHNTSYGPISVSSHNGITRISKNQLWETVKQAIFKALSILSKTNNFESTIWRHIQTKR